ncbi:phospholipase D-like domain-containing protein [Flavobacterium aciduliphilum]|uniref:Uncharacterized protein n=1 Tax=Flavobacterium aciduliphilum TaxID=1101402 RepID=A0A328YIC1_9FLAO|nr:hypothetical protein [Flavobacterium aciduliphilum]RAR73709.1 hypothetical protein CLV55_10328 [Flavobacterium aciduliphilum]
MLHKSGYNLEKGAIDFISNNETITLFSAYIKLEELKQINIKNNIKQIIVRWEIEDLCKGVSDIELYHYCLDNGIALYRNTRLHMKAIWNNQDTVLFGSANITGKGLGEKNNYNYELNGIKESIDITDIIYFNQVISSSEYVSSDLYNQINEIVINTILPIITFPEIPTVKKEIDYFLLSQLPMSKSPDDLYEVVIHSEDFDTKEQGFAAHDVALFGIDVFQDYSLFKIELKEKFNAHPFIIALKEHIKSQLTKSLSYGRVIDWIKINTTTVPTPRSWDLKQDQIVNNLYTWICEFDEKYSWDTPNHSQVIFYNGNK